MTDNRTNEPTNEALRKALNVAREHFSAIAASGEIKVWEDTGEKRGIDYQAKVWAERGARLASEALAATRVPAQGEPNGAVKAVIDRDVAIDAIAGGTISVPGGYGVLHGDDAANIVDAIIGHATVPDAATSAIERVRSVCAEAKAAKDRNVATSKRLGYASSSTSERVPGMDDVLAALDGAPEPETAPENYEPKCNGACVVHGSPVTNWPVQYGRRNRETGTLHWLNGDPFDSWWHENQDSYEHIKRYTSPPLPVEGEKP